MYNIALYCLLKYGDSADITMHVTDGLNMMGITKEMMMMMMMVMMSNVPGDL
jgi:alkylhydroperoxidase/carboxymuconolactone decarboxylase family protein YurZ